MKKKIVSIIASFLAIQLALASLIILPTAYAEGPTGNMNVDIDITAETDEIQSGQTGIYNLTFKVTGSTTQFTGAQIVVNLPQNAQFSQPLSEIEIAGVQPTYDADSATLTYKFSTLATGQVYTSKIKVIPPNGTTPDRTTLNAEASFTAAEVGPASDSAAIEVTADAGISITKSYTSTEGKTAAQPPFQGDIGVWTISVSVPKTQFGQLYLQEGSMITVSDPLPAGTLFDSASEGGIYDNQSGLISWSFEAPSIVDQQNSTDTLFEKTFTVNLIFDPELENFTTITNTANVEATTIDDQTLTGTASASRQIASSDNTLPPEPGTFFEPTHRVNGDYVSPSIYNWDQVLFYTQYAIGQPYIDNTQTPWSDSKVLSTGFAETTQEYQIDDHLNLASLITAVPVYQPSIEHKAVPLPQLPRTTIQAEVGGVWRTAYEVDYSKETFHHPNPDLDYQWLTVPLSDLNIVPGEHVQALKISYYNVSGGLLSNRALHMMFDVDPNFSGDKVTNSVSGYGVFADNDKTPFTVSYGNSGPMAPRSANILDDTKNIAVVSNSVKFEETDGNGVNPGTNTIVGSFANDSSSQKRMTGPFGDMVLLPIGVTVDSANPEATFKNNTGDFSPSNGTFKIADNDYQGTGRQLIKITWTATEMTPRQDLGFRFNVLVSADTPSPQKIDSYGFSGEADITPAAGSGTTIEQNSNNITGSGNLTEPLAHTSTQYVLSQSAGLVTQKLVKGDLDSAFTSFGHASPGGTITYELDITNKYTDVINNMTLFDVLPSVGDLGITDNTATKSVERGSKWTPELAGPITLPAEWQGKVKVSYSESANPKRADDLNKNTVYPASTTHLSDPVGAEDPQWMDEGDVTSWGAIHCFKLELISGVQFVRGASMKLQFSMTAPTNLDPSLTDPTIPEATRAAWNSFAYATNDSQAVEPARVGVVVNRGMPEEPVVTKTVNGQSSIKIANRTDAFHYAVAFNFGTATSSWDAVSLIDDLTALPAVQGIPVQDVLEFVPSTATIRDENGSVVVQNGSLSTSESRIAFDINKQNGSYSFLEGHTYTLEVDAKIRNSATDAQLQAFTSNSGIPNSANLAIQIGGTSKTIPSNTVTVIPPTTSTSGTGKMPQTGDVTLALLAAVALAALAGTLRARSMTKRKHSRGDKI